MYKQTVHFMNSNDSNSKNDDNNTLQKKKNIKRTKLIKKYNY